MFFGPRVTYNLQPISTIFWLLYNIFVFCGGSHVQCIVLISKGVNIFITSCTAYLGLFYTDAKIISKHKSFISNLLIPIMMLFTTKWF